MPEEHPRRIGVAIRTLGCKVNQAESEGYAEELLGEGYVCVPEADAQIVVVNTCTVTAEADRKARKLIRHVSGLPQAPLVLATGCLAAVDPQSLQTLGPRVLVEGDRSRVARRLAEALEPRTTPVTTSARGDRASGSAGRPGFCDGGRRRTRVQLKVQDGCDNGCAYCIVPAARGGPVSVPLSRVVGTARSLVDAGVREIVVTGVNLGRYRDGAVGLPGLVRKLGATGVERLRLSSIEPPDVTDELLEALASLPSVCPHLHVPLQSGASDVLRRMGRGYDPESFEERLEAAQAALPGLAVTTDVMVGFPGESETDARATRGVCERVGFAKLHVFRYSRRPGTRAAAMDDQVPPATAAARAAALREVGEVLRERYLDGRAGGVADVLVESVGERYAEGTTGDYLRVRLPSSGVSVGAIVAVKLGGRAGRVLAGTVRDPSA